jgi:hypothetical protein
MVIVVVAMPTPQKTMHNVFVGEPGDAFHEEEGSYDQGNVYQHFCVN